MVSYRSLPKYFLQYSIQSTRIAITDYLEGVGCLVDCFNAHQHLDVSRAAIPTGFFTPSDKRRQDARPCIHVVTENHKENHDRKP